MQFYSVKYIRVHFIQNK